MDKGLGLTIAFWGSKLKDKGLYEPSTLVLMEQTIKYLKELQNVQRKANG